MATNPSPLPARRDRKRLVGCAVVLVPLVILVVLAAYGLGLWSLPGGPPKPAVAPNPAPAGGVESRGRPADPAAALERRPSAATASTRSWPAPTLPPAIPAPAPERARSRPATRSAVIVPETGAPLSNSCGLEARGSGLCRGGTASRSRAQRRLAISTSTLVISRRWD